MTAANTPIGLGRGWRCATMLSALLLAGCAADAPERDSPASPGPSMSGIRGYKVGKPYQIKGVWYYPQVDYSYSEEGVASWYGPGFDGKMTANGEVYDMNDLTAAHKTLPLPSIVRVTNLDNGRSLQLRVNDRGPFVGDRIIDVSRRGAQLLGFHTAGTARVRVEIVEDESRQLLASLAAASGTTVAQASPPVPPLAASPVYAATPTAPAPDPAPEIGQVPMAMEPLPAPMPVEVAEVPPIAANAGVLFASAAVPAGGYAAPPVTSYPGAEHRVAWVQAGAFADYDRADRAKQRLSAIGPVVMIPSRMGGRELTRVRVGPFKSDRDAERARASVSQAGYPDSRLVLE